LLGIRYGLLKKEQQTNWVKSIIMDKRL